MVTALLNIFDSYKDGMMGFLETVTLAEVINLLAYSVTRNVFIKLKSNWSNNAWDLGNIGYASEILN